MKAILLVPALLVAVSSVACSQSTAPDRTPAAVAGNRGHMVPEITWGPVPPVLPPGAQIAVLSGNPFGEGVYTLRLKMPNGYVVPPHFHPTDEDVTVIEGNLLFAHGDQIDRKAMTTLPRGGFVVAAAQSHHYVIAKGETIVQVHGLGPFAITYVNPQDDPQHASSGSR